MHERRARRELRDARRRDPNWLGGGADPRSICEGTRVRYYPVHGEPEFRTGVAMMVPWQLGHGAWVVHVKLDDNGRTIHGASLEHIEVMG